MSPLKKRESKASHLPLSGGIWYLVRLPGGWRLMCHSFNASVPEIDHTQFWESVVVPFLALRWKLSKGQSAELSLLAYGFLRGRVVKSATGYSFFNGEDFSSFATKRQIAGAFRIRSRFAFRFDDHERCQCEDKQALRALLGIEDDWPAARD